MRIINNEHISNYDVTLKQKLQQCNSDKDYTSILRLGDDSQYDSDSSSKNFSVKEMQEAAADRKAAFTVYEQDKLSAVAEGLKALDDDK